MQRTHGVYICRGCGIAEAVDVDALAAQAAKTAKTDAARVKVHDVLCSPEGVAMINREIKDEGVNCLSIGACSPRVKYEEFDFPGLVMDRASLRELVAWGQDKATEETEEHYHPQGAANDYLTMSIIKVQKSELPEPDILEDLSKAIMVVGGGMAGLTSALEAAKAGYEVILVEKEAELGGMGAKLFKQTPSEYPFEELQEPLVLSKIKQVLAHEKIKVFTSTTVGKTDGQPGLFDVTLEGGSTETLRVGALVLAAGWKPYDASKLGHLGYAFKNVVTNTELEEMAKKGRITRPSDGGEPKKVVFIQCAGSRDPEHLPYCSSHCCATSLKQAKYVRDLNPEATACILYRDLRTPGQMELFYKKMQDDPGVMMTKADVTGVIEIGGGNLSVSAENTFLGQKIKLEADLVVLATGIVPVTAESQQYLDALDEAAAKGDEAKAAYLDSTSRPEMLLNLNYVQGPELPSLEGASGFADSNFICFQYETRRTGIYSAGCVRQPMDMSDTALDAAGAALKAIQCVQHVAEGKAVHPRAWDTTYPDPMMQRCTLCKRCTQECPFGAIEEDEKGTPFFKINRCRRCGTCMGACPERIISFKDFSVDLVGAMLKNIDVPDEGLRVLCLVCENDAYPALDTAAQMGHKFHPAIRFLPVRCLGATNLVWVADAFSRGIDGLLLLGCKFGENYQCHFIKGSELAEQRFGKVQETLNRLQLEAERCQMLQVAISDFDNVHTMVDDFVKQIDEIGPNPFKGF